MLGTARPLFNLATDNGVVKWRNSVGMLGYARPLLNFATRIATPIRARRRAEEGRRGAAEGGGRRAVNDSPWYWGWRL